MIQFLGKLVGTVVPSVTATVLAAYVVNYYVVPKPADDKPPVQQAAPAVVEKPKAAPVKPEPVAVRPADKVDSAPAKPRASEASKVEPKIESKPATRASAHEPPATPERERAVNHTETPAPAAERPKDLVRAAMERQRAARAASNQRPAEDDKALSAASPQQPVVPHQTPVTASQPIPEPVQTVASPTPAAIVQPLPPPVQLAPPPSVGAITTDSPDSARAEQDRPNGLRPPGEIPAPDRRNDQATRDSTPNPSSDVLSAARSVFESVIPR